MILRSPHLSYFFNQLLRLRRLIYFALSENLNWPSMYKLFCRRKLHIFYPFQHLTTILLFHLLKMKRNTISSFNIWSRTLFFIIFLNSFQFSLTSKSSLKCVLFLRSKSLFIRRNNNRVKQYLSIFCSWIFCVHGASQLNYTLLPLHTIHVQVYLF